MLDMEQARFNMIEQQIRPCEVLDGRILELLKHVRREHFVPEDNARNGIHGYGDPAGLWRIMWQPKLEARTVQELHLGRKRQGAGGGYRKRLSDRAAVVLAGHVTSVEIVPELSAMAGQHLHAYHRDNIKLEVGDAARGWGGGANYDAIVLTGSTPVLPAAFQNSLNIGGRLFAIVGDAPVMEARLITRVAADTFETVNIMETCCRAAAKCAATRTVRVLSRLTGIAHRGDK